MRVHILNRGTNLVHIALDFQLVQALASAKQLVQGLVGAKFE